MQYRGGLLPLVRIGPPGDGDGNDPLNVVVLNQNGRSVGLVVDAIIDITDDVVLGGADGQDGGIAGSAVVQSRVTELLDVRALIALADPDLAAEAATTTPGAAA